MSLAKQKFSEFNKENGSLYMCNDREHTYLKKVTALLHIMVSKLKYDFFNKALHLHTKHNFTTHTATCTCTMWVVKK